MPYNSTHICVECQKPFLAKSCQAERCPSCRAAHETVMRRARQKRHYAAHKDSPKFMDRKKAISRLWRETHLEEAKASSSRHRATHAEERRQQARVWRAAHPEQCRANAPSPLAGAFRWRVPRWRQLSLLNVEAIREEKKHG